MRQHVSEKTVILVRHQFNYGNICTLTSCDHLKMKDTKVKNHLLLYT